MDSYYTPLIGGFLSMFSALVGAFSGGGSSFILFPLLLVAAPASYISLLAITKIMATVMAVVSARVHITKSHLNWKLFSVITIVSIIGTGVGTYLVQYRLYEQLYKMILGVALITTAVYLYVRKEKGLGKGNIKDLSLSVYIHIIVFCFLTSVFNGLFGGTGIFLTTYFVIYLGMPFILAIAYTMISYSIVNGIQTAYLLYVAPFDVRLAIMVLVGAFFGAWIGTQLQYLKGNVWVKRFSIALMAIIGIKMFIG